VTYIGHHYVIVWLSRNGKVRRAPRKYVLKVGGRFQTLSIAPLTPMANTARARYSGHSRKLIVALDIGTTFSGAAYALLDPGEVPEIQSVTRQVSSPIPGLAINGDEQMVGI